MGLRFYRRMKIAPGVTMNLSKSGPSFSFGPRGLKYTVGRRGTRTTFGIPGTGLYYTKSKCRKSNTKNDPHTSSSKESGVLNLGFLKRIFASAEEKVLIEGIKAFLSKNNDEAIKLFQQNLQNVDSMFMAGFLLLGRKNYSSAEKYFDQCTSNLNEFGLTINKYASSFELLLDITDFIEAPIILNKRGLYFSLVEAYQHQKKYNEAYSKLSQLWNENPSDEVVCLSLCDLIVNADKPSVRDLRDIIEITKDMENDQPIHTNILYLRGYALHRLGLSKEAVKQFTSILRKKRDRPDELLLQIRYVRALIYEALGEKKKARNDYEAIYTINPKIGSVAAKLGL